MKNNLHERVGRIFALLLILFLSGTMAIGQSINTFPFYENFDGTATGWTSGGTTSSWAMGAPTASTINAPYSPGNVWATNLSGNYSNNESSWVQTPEFNFTSVTEPVVEFKMWYETQTNYTDGVTFQYSLDAGLTWDYLGIGLGALSGDPNGDNWFNTMSIEGLQFYNGWAGSTGGWETMKYYAYGASALVDLSGEPSVTFRFLFGSNSGTNQNGIAVDDFSVYQTPTIDLRAMSITTDPTCIGSTSLNSVHIEVKNEGSVTQNTFNVSYSVDGGSSFVTETVNDTLAFGQIETYTFTTQADLTLPGTYNVVGSVTLAGDQNSYNDTTYNQIEIIGGTLTDNFETWGPTQTTNSCTVGTLGATGTSGWLQDQTDGGEWRLDAGGTGSSNTGPSVDYDPGTSAGYYLYTEASSCYGATVSLLSPCFDFTSAAYKINFAYHMYGSTMGTLSVDVWDGTQWVNDVWMASGDHGDIWNEASVGLGAFSNSDAVVRLRGVTGSNYYSDIAIDAIEMVELLPNDAAVVGLYPTVFCPGTVDMYAIVANAGNNIISSLDIHWTADGVAQTTNNYLTPITTGGLDTILLGSFTFAAATQYDFSIWSANPNSGSDSNTANDTLVFEDFQASLSGTFTIGGTTPHFANFVDAVDALVNFGMCGPVEFVAAPGTYTGQLDLVDIVGADSLNTITFRGATGDSTDVVVEYGGTTGANDNFVLRVSQDYVTIQNLTLKNTSGTYGQVLWLEGTNYSNFSNNVFEGIVSTSSNASVVYSYNSASDNYNTIANNLILNGYRSIYLYASSGSMENGNMIIGNVCKDYNYYGIYGYYQHSVQMTGNYVEQHQSGNNYNYPVYAQYCDGPIQVTKNTVIDNSGTYFYGIRIYYCDALPAEPGLTANNMVSIAGVTSTCYGLYLYQSNNQLVYNNSVNLTSGSTSSYAAYLYASACSYQNYQFKNNNIVNTGGGYAIYITDDCFLCPVLFSEFNNLYATGNYLAKLQSTDLATLADWQNYYPLDASNNDGGFAGTHDLHSNSVALNGTGTPIAIITDDIDGDPRDPATPDIGADEFTPVQDDAGIIAIIGLDAVCPGVADVSVTINNYGLVDLNTVTVNWEVNGVLQTPFVYNDTIAVGATADVLIGSYTFVNGVAHDVSAWTSAPNGGADGNSGNDQFDLIGMQTAILGTYTIGAAGDFLSVGAAADHISQYGICGEVVFNIEPGTYSEQVTLGEVSGADSLNTITFQSSTGIASDVVIEYGATADANNWVLGFHGVDYCTVQNITIKSIASGNYGRVVTFHYGANHNSLLNNDIQSVYVTSSSAACIRSYNDTQDNYNTISGNSLTGGYYGVYWYASSASPEIGNQFHNNTIIDYYYYGLYQYYQQNLKSTGNYIEQLASGNAYNYPFYAYYCDGHIEITDNVIYDNGGTTCYGVRAYYCDGIATAPSLIANNMISTENMTGSNYGLYVYNSLHVDIYHNSVYLAGGTNINYPGYLYLASTSYGPYNFKNNSMVNTGTGGYCLYGYGSGISKLTSSNNNLFTNSSTLCSFTSTYPTLTDWQVLYSGDVVSTNANYYAVDDLHSLSPEMDGAGTPITIVTTDIDGDVRDVTNPDIGADEFMMPNNDAKVKLYYSYGEVPIEGGADVVAAIVMNVGLNNQVNLPITLDITGANTFTSTITLPLLASGAVDTIYFAPFTPTTVGLNNLMVSVPLDENNTNNEVTGYNMATQNLFAYADTTGSVGNGGVQNGRIYQVKYNMGALKQVYEIQAFITDDPDNAGNSVFGVVLDANHNIITTGDTVVLDSTHINTWVSLPISNPAVTSMANTEFYAGFAQTPKVAGDYHPIGFQSEDPMRWDAYYYSNLDGSSITPFTNNRRWMIKAKVQDPAPFDANMLGAIAPLAECGLAMETIVAEVSNNGTDLITSIDLSYLVTGAAAPVTETVSLSLLPGDVYTYSFTTQYDFTVAGADSVFEIITWANLSGDTLAFNDTAYYQVESMYVPVDPIPYGTTVVYGNAGTVSVVSNDNVIWYDDPSATNFIAMGDTFFNTPVLYDTTSYWALATSSSQGDFTIGTGVNNNTGTSCNPFGQFYTSNQSQFIYLASDLAAAGIMPGSMNALSLNCITPTNATSSGYNMDNFNIEMGHTSASVMSTANWVTGLSSVYAAPNWVSTVGWNYYEFQNSFEWNGIDNVIIQFCFSNYYGSGSYSSNGSLAGDNMPYTVGAGSYTDGAFTCGQSPNQTTSWRPQIILNATVPGCESNLVEVVAEVTNIPDYNAGVFAYSSPNSGAELTLEDVCIEIENTGGLPISGFPVVYEIDNGTILTEIFLGTILPGDVATYCFTIPADITPFGTYNFCAYTQLSNDTWFANDTICWTVVNDPLIYCGNSYANYSSYVEITNVALNTFSNSSAPASGATYTDYTALNPIVLQKGATYPISIQSGFAPGYSYTYTCYAEVYIDWNHDGEWDETTDELVFGHSMIMNSGTSGTMNVPVTALTGTHGMRVVLEYTSTAAGVLPCGAYSYGETEDYVVTVVNPIDHDAGATAIISPSLTGLTQNDIEPVEVIVTNLGLMPINTMTVDLELNGAPLQTIAYSGSLDSFETDTIFFSDLTIPGGYFDLCAYTTLQGDTNTFNDTLCVSYYALPQFNLEMTMLDAPVSGCNMAMEDVTITLTNLGDSITDGVTVAYVNNTMPAPVVEVITDTIPEGATFEYTFATQVNLAVAVDTDFDFTAYCAYGLDPVQSNDTIYAVVSSGVSPSAPSADDVTIWSSEIATLNVNNVDTNLNYYWYGPDTVQIVADSMLVTPQLFDTTTYYLTAASGSSGSIGISEVSVGTPDYVEIMNFTNSPIDATGWVVAASNSYTDINNMNSTLWNLGILQANEVQYKTDNSGSNYWGSNLMWNPGASSSYRAWVVILDNNGNIVDFWCQGWTLTELANFTTPINGFTVDFSTAWQTDGLSMSSNVAERAVYDTDEDLDWDVVSSGSMGIAYTGLTNQGGSGSGCETELVAVNVFTQYADYDGGVVNIVSPNSWCYLTNEEVTIDIYNNGLNPLTGFSAYYTLDGGTPVTETVTATILPGDTLTYTFATLANVSSYTSYAFCAGVTVASDGYNLNDEMCWTVENWNGCGLNCADAFPYGEPGDPAIMSETTFAYDSEWWSFTITEPFENVVVSLCGSQYNTQLQVWDSCGAFGASYTNNNSCGNQSQISIPGIMQPGTYYVRVYGYDTNYGIFTLNITGNKVPKFEIIETLYDVDCNGTDGGSASVTLGPGAAGTTATLPVTYAWYDASGTYLSNMDNLPNMVAGTYTISVTDLTGWMETETYTITEPTAVVIDGIVTNATSFGGNDGAIDLSVTGGVSPYTYSWSNGTSNEDALAIYASVHTVVVTDDNGCNNEASFSVTSPIPDSTWIQPTTAVSHDIVIPFNAFVTLDGSGVEPGSIIGVFYNANGSLVCGGYTFWSGMDAVVTAYGTDPNSNNGFAPGETFTWKVYDVAETEAFGGVATYNTSLYPNSSNFAIAGLSGLQAAEFQSIITQSIVLPAGWSIWSTFIDPTTPSIDMVMADIVSPCFTPGILEIVKNGAGQIYWPFYCLNTIGDIAIGEGYQAKTNSTTPETFGVTGLQITPEITEFTIPAGWSILGYLRATQADISVMLAPLTSACFTTSCLEIAKNGAGQIYWPFYCLNTIGDMIPGEGYQVKLNCGATPFLYPANTAASSKSHVSVNHTVNFESVTPSGDNMSIGIPAEAWDVEPMIGDEIGVFNSSNELIGAAVYDGDFTAITAWGKELIQDTDKGSNGQAFSMKLWHSTTGMVEEIIVENWKQGNDEYLSNGISIVGKLVLESNGSQFVLGQNMPNPYTGMTRIPFYLPENCTVSITVYNAIGELVEEVISESRAAGAHVVEFDGSKLEAGNYFYKLITDKFTSTKPMSIK